MHLNKIDFVIIYSVLALIVMLGLLHIRNKSFVRRENIKANNARAIARHNRWIVEHPYCDDSHPEAQRLLRQRINAYGIFAKEFHPIDGEERLRELINKLESANV